jgi:leucyl-tRNA synthetase
MDANNNEEMFSKEAINYWQDVDLYIGGSEHATGHLLYSRFWQKFMFDRGFVPTDEYAKKLINQGMITGTSAFVYRVSQRNDVYVSKDFVDEYYRLEDNTELFNKIQNYTGVTRENLSFDKIHVDVSFVSLSDELNIDKFRKWRPEFLHAKFITKKDDDVVIVIREVEKMSKSKYNVVNPDTICEEYGADSLRLFEMFLGPLEQSKPWKTSGISGVYNFLKKLWKLYHTGENGTFYVDDSPLSEGSGEALKTLHKTIKKVEEDIENFSFNTSVSTFMIAVNELTALKCNKRAILEPLAIIIEPYAPHIAEELWSKLGHTTSVSTAVFPIFEPEYLVESSKVYPVSFNGKMRFTMELSLDLTKDEIEAAVMAHDKTKAQLQGRTPKKVIIVPGKIINIVG